MSAKLTAEDYHRVAEERGVRWIGEEVPPSAKSPTSWQCSCGELWEAAHLNMRRKTKFLGCQKCQREQIAKERRLSEDDYFSLAERRGFKWLGPAVMRNRDHTKWECEQGHQWWAVYAHIQQGKGCPHCAKNFPKNEDDYRSLASEIELKWLGPFVPNTGTPTAWQCPEGHIWKANYLSVAHQGTGCPVCAGNMPKTEDDYRNLANERGFEWLGPLPMNTTTKTRWLCQNGHEWEALYSNLKKGVGCPYCAGKGGRHAGDYHSLAEKRGLVWLGPKTSRTKDKTWWRCQFGHKWETTYGNIWSGTGCPHCAGVVQKTSDDYYALALARGYNWLGPEVDNIRTNTKWRCTKGHVWWARYGNIYNGRGCPKCDDRENGARVSQPQRDLFAMLEKLPKAELNTRYGRFTLDITFELEGKINICVEYDCWYWHKDNQKYDAWRSRRLIHDGWRVLRVKSSKKLPTQTQLDAALAELVGGAKYVEIVLDDWGGVDTPSVKA